MKPYIRVANVSEVDSMKLTIVIMSLIIVIGLGALAIAWYLSNLVMM